jgi:hypothetical protein
MIQATHKGIEIEMELHQLTHGYWTCDSTLAIYHGDEEFPTMDLAREPPCGMLATIDQAG